MAASLREALVERAAKVDRLTGAASRRVLEQRLEEAFARSREEGSSIAVVICDLDHFKRINDTYGHPTGDLALKSVAQVLLAPARGGDLCARYGGEEFVLLFEETSGETALEIAERLRKRVEALAVEAPSGDRLTLTMSVGVAAAPELAVKSAHDLLHLADHALYTAKHLGRNLCLLDTGQGRLRTAAGDLVELAERAGTSSETDGAGAEAVPRSAGLLRLKRRRLEPAHKSLPRRAAGSSSESVFRRTVRDRRSSLSASESRWALILGASSGFGEAAALEFAAAGYDIFGVHFDRRQAMPHVEEIRAGIAATGRAGALLQHQRRRPRQARRDGRRDGAPRRRPADRRRSCTRSPSAR